MADEAVKKFKCHFCGNEFDQKDVHDIQYVDDGELSTDDETNFIICTGCINTAYERKDYQGCEVCERWTDDMRSVEIRAGRHMTGPLDGAEPPEDQDMCLKCAERKGEERDGPD